MQCGENGWIETRETKRKNGEAREAEQEEEETDEMGEEIRRNMVEETSGNNTRGGSTCVLLSIIYRSAPYARSLPFGITIHGARCVFDR